MTWPLALGLTADVPGDLGDSLLNMWILAWGAEHLPQVLTGALPWREFWNANIFHPEPLALALSEHLVGQVVQILPVYWLTGNVILAYNLLFIATFALSAVGVFLLVRDLTGNPRAAFVAGLIYGFLPYRIASVPHLQVMSSQWMPFALWGLNRFLAGTAGAGTAHVTSTAGSTRWLVAGVAALIMQNLSCGYYLLYFAPFVPGFVIFRMWNLGVLRNLRIWASLAAGAVATVALTLPFLLPYQAAQDRFGFERPFAEVVQFSANVWSYVTASENLVLWGDLLRFYPRPEGETFLGFIPWLLAIGALIAVVMGPRDRGRGEAGPSQAPWIRRLSIVLAIAAALQLLALLGVILLGGVEIGPISARTPMRALMQFVVLLGLLLATSARARARCLHVIRSPEFFCVAAALMAVWLSLGPRPRTGDALIANAGPYSALYEHVPGFNGVRVPARYAMIAGLFLAIAAGYGARRVNTSNVLLFTSLSALVLADGLAVPFEINRTWSQNQTMPPARVLPHTNPPEVYAQVAALPTDTVLAEFPFGDGAWEIRYVYYAAAHWKPIVNGYSGTFPPRYRERVARLNRIAVDPQGAWQSLIDAGTTHVILHRNAYAMAADADEVDEWLRANGATEIGRYQDGDVLLALPR